jgi:hypothetical protein
MYGLAYSRVKWSTLLNCAFLRFRTVFTTHSVCYLRLCFLFRYCALITDHSFHFLDIKFYVLKCYKTPMNALHTSEKNRAGWDGVHLVCRPLFGLLYQLRMTGDERGEVCGMRIGRGNWSTMKNPAPVPLSLPQITHDLTWDRSWAAAVESLSYGTAPFLL